MSYDNDDDDDDDDESCHRGGARTKLFKPTDLISFKQRGTFSLVDFAKSTSCPTTWRSDRGS